MSGTGPIEASGFDALVAPLGPFGGRSRVAVAVSGGRDSMALLVLAGRWAAGAGRRLAALTVDHGLRAESAAEASRVAEWCAVRRIEHRILEWRGDKPSTAIQEAARAARYELMVRWCRDHGFTHLMLAHHLDDQAETLLMRMQRGSGVAGLAGMPAVALRGGVRILRPLLAVPRDRLAATLEAAGQDWLEDPGNRDRRFARVRIRHTAARLAERGVGTRDVGRVAAALGRARAARERELADLAGRAVAIFPEGYAEVDGETFRQAAPGLARSLLSIVLRTVGGAPYGPRSRRLERLAVMLEAGRPVRRHTLGGCLIEPAGNGFRICREPRAIRAVRELDGCATFRWDRRFDIAVSTPGAPARQIVRIGALGEAGWQAIAEPAGAPAFRLPPGSVLFGLPALWADGQVAEVPSIGYRRRRAAPVARISVRFRPSAPLCGPTFRLALSEPCII